MFDPKDPRLDPNESASYTAPPTPQPETQTERVYADANFTPRDQEPAVPRYYRPEPPIKEPKPKKERRGGMPAAAVVALCLVCALLGGLGGGVVGSLDILNDESPALSAPTESPDEATPTPTPVTTPAPVLSVTSPSADGAISPSAVYELACQQVVGITTEITTTNYWGYTSSSAVTGSGFVVSADGYILTNHHVIEDAYNGGYDITVMFYDGTEYLAEIIGFEADNDVALLKIDAAGLNPVTLADSDSIQVGDTVYAVGNPLGELTYTMTTGTISALDRRITTDASGTTINMFQLDAAVNSGNSGGPVYNASGEVIGIVTAKYQDTGVEGLGFAVPINDASYIANELIENGYVSGKAFFGLVPVTVEPNAAQYYNMVVGACIYSINEGSCAEKAGLKVGDIIVKLDDHEITSTEDLETAKKDYRAGDSAVITVYRSGEYLEFPIVFDEYVPAEDPVEPTPEPTPEPEQYPDMDEFFHGNWGFPFGW